MLKLKEDKVKIKIVTKRKVFKLYIEESDVAPLFKSIKESDWLDLESALINTKDIIYACIM